LADTNHIYIVPVGFTGHGGTLCWQPWKKPCLWCKWHVPHGGLFIWLQLPEGFSTNDLYPIALREKVKYLAGSVCYPDHKSYRYMRLNFPCIHLKRSKRASADWRSHPIIYEY
jgi:DNA-binding transcriptional MocR family regulator